MPAVTMTLEQLDLRWRGAFRGIAPGDTFTASTFSDGKNICLGLNGDKRCGYGYTIGDGWKLIFYPERWPGWALNLINALWVAGCVIGVGWWSGRTTVDKTTVRDGKGRYETVMVRIAVAMTIAGLLVVPWITGLKGTTLWEWMGALGGIEAGLMMGNRFRRPFAALRRPSPP